MDAWTMDFHGRVKLASKKNFQLIDIQKPDDVFMLFGKVTKSFLLIIKCQCQLYRLQSRSAVLPIK